jgi:hypothetical protein
MHAICPAHFILFDLMTSLICDEIYKLRRPSLSNFLKPPATSSFLGPNIFLSALFSNTLSPCSSLNMRHQVSHPYKTHLFPFTILNALWFCSLQVQNVEKGSFPFSSSFEFHFVRGEIRDLSGYPGEAN